MPIKYVMTKGNIPVKVWADIEEVESSALDQLLNVSNLPFIFKHIAVMPDVHYGAGSTIGSVIPTQGAVIPSAVGVDIGCGMQAVKTDLNPEQLSDLLPKLRHSIERSIPVGAAQNNKVSKENTTLVSNLIKSLRFPGKDSSRFKEKAISQFGSLGGGNHFIEICIDTENRVWAMLHSGSRGAGNLVARHYSMLAQDLCKQYFINLPDRDLSYFPYDTNGYKDYLNDLNIFQEYAKLNRTEMMNRVLRELSWTVNNKKEINKEMDIDCHHNYATMEHHFGKDVLVTRKGAIRAREGDLGIIPGSMGAKSFIVRGKGNPDSFNSASHGAGRVMSRGQARKQFNPEDIKSQTDGVECRKDEGILDEIPSCYKDIDRVIENENDLVEPIAQLKQVICVKG